MTPVIISTVTTQKQEFADTFTKKLISSSLRNIIERSIPFENNEKKALQDEKFKNGLKEISDVISSGVSQSFQKSGAMSSGSFFDNLIGTISSYVSMEAEDRMQSVFNDIKLGIIDTSNINWGYNVNKRFSNMSFKNKDIKKRLTSQLKSIISYEEANIIEDIKEEVKTSVDEAESKAEIIEETVEEINEVKKEYEEPEKPEEPVEEPLSDKEEEPVEGEPQEESNEDDSDQDSDKEKEPVEGEPQEESNEDDSDQDSDKEKDTKEIKTAEEAAQSYIPIIPKYLKNNRNKKDILPESMAYDFFKANGNIEKEVSIRMNSLKYAIESSPPDDMDYLTEYEDLQKLTKEAFKQVKLIDGVFNKLGLTQNGLYRKDSIALESARNIIGRFVNKTIPVSVYSNDLFPIKEKAISHAFDFIQFKNYVHNYTGKSSVKAAMIKELEARESAFYKNIVNVDDPAIKDAALQVMKLQNVKLDRVINPNFVKDYNFKVWESNIGSINNVKNVVKERVKSKIEKAWGRPLNNEELDIIEAVTNNEDATEIVPTEFEKFVIKFGKEVVSNSSESVNFSNFTKNKIAFKAKVFTTIYKTLEHLQIMDSTDKKQFDSFLNAF